MASNVVFDFLKSIFSKYWEKSIKNKIVYINVFMVPNVEFEKKTSENGFFNRVCKMSLCGAQCGDKYNLWLLMFFADYIWIIFSEL